MAIKGKKNAKKPAAGSKASKSTLKMKAKMKKGGTGGACGTC